MYSLDNTLNIPAINVEIHITIHWNINGIIEMSTSNIANRGIGIPKEVPIFTITDEGTIIDTGDTIQVLWCHDCLYGSPKNCPKGIFNLCHGAATNKTSV